MGSIAYQPRGELSNVPTDSIQDVADIAELAAKMGWKFNAAQTAAHFFGMVYVRAEIRGEL